MEPENASKPVRRIHEVIEMVCGLYSRVARQLGMSPSFVSRVARGERKSEVVEQTLAKEFSAVATELLANYSVTP